MIKKLKSIINKRHPSHDEYTYKFFVFSNYAYFLSAFANISIFKLAIYFNAYGFAVDVFVSFIAYVFAIYLNYLDRIKMAFYCCFIGICVLIFSASYYLGDIGVKNALIFILILGCNNIIFKKRLEKILFVLSVLAVYVSAIISGKLPHIGISEEIIFFANIATGCIAIFIFYMFAEYFMHSTDVSIKSQVDIVYKEGEKTNQIVHNVFPSHIVQRLKDGERSIADRLSNVTILFTDMVGFTKYSQSIDPNELVYTLNELFSMFDRICLNLGLEKIKTVGDAYMLAGGLNAPAKDEAHIENTLKFAISIKDELKKFNGIHGTKFKIRVGIHLGDIVAGIIGNNKLSYDVWGDAVNIASRLETTSLNGAIQVSEEFYNKIDNKKYAFIMRKNVYLKGKGNVTVYFLPDDIGDYTSKKDASRHMSMYEKLSKLSLS